MCTGGRSVSNVSADAGHRTDVRDAHNRGRRAAQVERRTAGDEREGQVRARNHERILQTQFNADRLRRTFQSQRHYRIRRSWSQRVPGVMVQ